MTRGGAAAGRAVPDTWPRVAIRMTAAADGPRIAPTLVSDAEKQGASAMVVTRTGRISRV